ncbi:MAG: PQQ-binding-like beta-propeller repeat protein [Candidatus Brocadiia bacterium]
MRPAVNALVLLLAATASWGAEPEPTARGRLAAALRRSLAATAPRPSSGASLAEPEGAVTADYSPHSRPNAALERARRLEQDERWSQAIELYQRLVDEAPHELCHPEPRRYVPIRSFVEERLAALPPEGRRVYRAAVDGRAAELYHAAVASGDLAALRLVAQRFLLSSWGDDALDRLATAWLARGKAGQALRAWRRLLRLCSDTDTDLVATAAKLATCLQRLGRPAAARALLRRAANEAGPGATLAVAGRRIPLAAYAKVLDRLPRLATEASEWAYPGGCPARPDAATPVRPGPLLWSDLIHAKAVAQAAAFRSGRQAARRAARPYRPPVWVLPAVGQGRVIYPSRGGVVARDLDSGKLLWELPWPPTSGRLVEPFSTATSSSVGRWWCSARGQRVYCSFPMLRTSHRVRGQEMVGEMLAVGAARGALRWQHGAEEHLPKPLASGWFVSPPLPRGERLMVGLRAGETGHEYHLCALRARDGGLLWRRFVCSRPASRFFRIGLHQQWFEGMPASGDGLVVACAGGGIVAAAETATGRLAWLFRYDQADEAAVRTGRIVLHDGWRTPTPVVADGVAYVTPVDSDFLYALDLATGRFLWRAERQDHHYLAAADRGGVYLAGRRAASLSAEGELEWEAHVPAEVVGRPALAGHVLHLPVDGGLLFLDARTGHKLAETSWAEWKSTHEPTWDADLSSGDLLIAEGRLFVATPFTLNVFSPLEPRPALERELARNPQDPRVHFAVAKEHQWEGDLAAAAAAFEKTLELAAQHPEALSAGELGDVRRRLSASYAALSRRHQEARRHDMALNAARAALRYAEPLEAPCLHLRVARLCTTLRQWDEAIEAYHHVLAAAEPRGPDWQEARRGLGDLLARAGRGLYERFEQEAAAALREGSQRSLQEVVRRYPNSRAAPQALLGLAAAARRDGRLAQAKLWLHRLAHDYPASPHAPEALYRLALVHARAGARAMARGALRALGREHPEWRAVVDGRAASAKVEPEALLAEHFRAPRPAEAPTLAPPLAVQWGVPQEYGSSELYVAGDRGGADEFFLLVGRSFECREAADGALRWADRPGWIGIHILDADRRKGGVLVRGVVHGTPAARAGLRNGDVIVSFDARAVRHVTELIDTCLARRPGTRVAVRFLRDGEEHKIHLELGERPTQAGEFHLQPHSFVGLAGGCVFVRREQRLDAIRVEGGARAWSFALEQSAGGLEADGAAWASASAPGIVAIADERQRLFALDPQTGRVLWTRPLAGPSLRRLALWEHGLVAAYAQPSAVEILNPFDGRLLFRVEARRALTPPLLAPAGRGRLCYAMGSTLGCYDAAAEELVWSRRVENFASRRLWVAGQRLVAHGEDGRGLEVLECRRADSGEALWSLALQRGESLQRAALTPQALYAATRRAGVATLVRLDARSGEVAWEYALERDTTLDDWCAAPQALFLGLSRSDVVDAQAAAVLTLDPRTGEEAQEVSVGKGRLHALQLLGRSLYAVVEEETRRPAVRPPRILGEVPGESPRFRIVRIAAQQ